MKKIRGSLMGGLSAGILISLGGAVFLKCDNRYVGAVLFAVALTGICMLGCNLYTGKICYIPQKHDRDALTVLLMGLLGNIVATAAAGYLLRYAVPELGSAAETLCAGKLAAQNLLQTLIRGIFCGCCIYIAVEIYKSHQNTIGILLGIPVFILSGFEHSVADMFYFAASGIVSLEAFVFIAAVIAGNSIGGMLLPVLRRCADA